jgi:hypothetical protein
MIFSKVLGKLGLWRRLCHYQYLKNVVERTFAPWNSFKMEASIILGVGGRKAMLEKLFLAVTITFSLNLFLQVHIPDRSSSQSNYQQQTETTPNLIVRLPKK